MKNTNKENDALWNNLEIDDLNSNGLYNDAEPLSDNMQYSSDPTTQSSQSLESGFTTDQMRASTKSSAPGKNRSPKTNININKNKSNNTQKSNNSSSKKKPMSSMIKSASNVTSKTAQAGGTVIKGTFSLTSSIGKSAFRIVTLALILWTMYLLFDRFWKNYPALGSINSIANNQNYSLAAYFGVAIILLLFELLSLLRASTSQKLIDNGHIIRYDTGRGMFSFPIIYAGSFLAAHYTGLIPMVHPAISGVQNALNLYGSMQQPLLTICILGMLSCIARWICSRFSIAMRGDSRK